MKDWLPKDTVCTPAQQTALRHRTGCRQSSVCLGTYVNVCWSYCRSRNKMDIFPKKKKMHESFLDTGAIHSSSPEPLKSLEITHKISLTRTTCMFKSFSSFCLQGESGDLGIVGLQGFPGPQVRNKRTQHFDCSI